MFCRKKEVQMNSGISPQMLSAFRGSKAGSETMTICDGNIPIAVVIDYKTYRRLVIKEEADKIIDQHRHVFEELAK